MDVQSSGAKTKTLQLRLLGHCLICLRKTDKYVSKVSTRNNRDASVVSKAVLPPRFLNTFNTIFTFLRNGGHINNAGGWSIAVHNDDQTTNQQEEEGLPLVVEFARVPTLCQTCVDILQQLDNLFKAVTEQVKLIRKIMEDPRPDGQGYRRGEQFKRKLQSAALEEEVTLSTLKFLESFGVGLGSCEKRTTTIVASDRNNKSGSTVHVESKNDSCSTSARGPDLERRDVCTPTPTPPTNVNSSSKTEITNSEYTDQDYIEKGSSDKLQDDSAEMEWNDMEEMSESSHNNDDDPLDDPDYIKSEKEDSDEMAESEDYEDSDLEEFDTSAPQRSYHALETNTVEPRMHLLTSGESHPITHPRRKFRCVLRSCRKLFSSQAELSTHYHTIHVTDLPFRCEFPGCGRAYEQELALNRHMFTHPNSDSNNSAPQFPCHCGEAYYSEESLKNHLRKSKRHAAEKKPKCPTEICDICGVRVPVVEYTVHIQDHVGDYAIPCPNKPTCSYLSPHIKSMINHFKKSSTCKEVAVKKNFFQYTCDTCGFQTSKMQVFWGHVKRNHERSLNKTIPCPISDCKEVFSVRQGVEIHLIGHKRARTAHKCEHCPRTIIVDKMEHHLKNEHGAQEIFPCHCACVFSTRESLIAHQYDHTFQHDGLHCDICKDDSIRYRQHNTLWEHYRKVHQIEPAKLLCSRCGTLFEKLNFHQKTCQKCISADVVRKPKPGKKFIVNYACDLCDDPPTFIQEMHLIDHKIALHGEDPHQCKSCPEKFATSTLLRRHEKEHAGIPIKDEVTKCEVEGCGKVFNSKYKYNHHFKSMHSERKHACEHCEKRFADRSRLKHHVDAVHLGLRPFICDVCGESFTSATTLKRHKMIHTGVRPYACHICGQKFRYKEVRQTHVLGHEEKGEAFKPNGPMKNLRKRKAQ